MKFIRIAASAVISTCISPAFAAFGYSNREDNIVIDAGSTNSLVFSVSRTSCDINSIKFRGHELQYPTTGSHLGSGLGTADVSVRQLGDDLIRVICTARAITHYMFVRKGDPKIYMATHITSSSVGELRFIARLNNDILPSEHPFGRVSDYSGYSKLVEGQDVVLVGTETRSKFYSAERYIDRGVHCVYGSRPEALYACMLIPQPETSSGGPFFRDIETSNGDAFNAIHNYMWSAHTQTEPHRLGLHGPYALSFSRSIPRLSEVDFGFLESQGIKGYVPLGDRGFIKGKVSGVSNNQAVIHWFNDHAQYWTRSKSDGSFLSPAMKPGSYYQRLYQTEYLVGQTSVAVTGSNTATKDITAKADDKRSSVFKIGECNGQPFEFKNSDKFLRMHPSDTHMENWKGDYTVGKSSPKDFPMAIFKDVNNGVRINFNLDSTSGTFVLRVATTLSFAAGRPQIQVNTWQGPVGAAPDRIDSRGVTRGAYRGYGEQYDFEISAGALREGSNTIHLNVNSGNSGDGFLSPNYIIDCIELYHR